MHESQPEVLFDQQTERGRVCVEQAGPVRSLHFDNGLLQSRIDLNSLDLPAKANRMMLAHLLFGIEPDTVLLAGCGGGAIARWFAGYLPNARGHGVEIDPLVIDLARRFFDYPAIEQGWQLTRADIRDFLSQPGEPFDFILFDIEENGSTPVWLFQPEFLQQVNQRLTEKGAVTFNLLAESAEQFAAALWPVRQIFSGGSCCLSDPDSRNLMITAFKNKPDTSNLTQTARLAGQKLALELEQFLAQMRRDNPPGSGIF